MNGMNEVWMEWMIDWNENRKNKEGITKEWMVE